MGLHEFDFTEKDPDPILNPTFGIGDIFMSIVAIWGVMLVGYIFYLIAKVSVIAALLLFLNALFVEITY